ncbi:hypothetical protein J437_LFUL014771, partial [Ladona fulva]
MLDSLCLCHFLSLPKSLWFIYKRRDINQGLWVFPLSINMAEKAVKIGQRVEVGGKDVQGVVAYVGTTLFAPGKWIGVILDEPKGKNNGTVMQKTYFECKENHGTFVRQSQISIIDGTSTEPTTPSTPSTSSSVTTPSSEDKSRIRASSLRKYGTPGATRLTTSFTSNVRRRAE